PLRYTVPEREPELLRPNPRDISRELLAREQFKPVPFLNLLAVSWIQFMTHDWFSHGENEIAMPYRIPLRDDDPFQQMFMWVPKTQRDATHDSRYDHPAPTYRNKVTHWW